MGRMKVPKSLVLSFILLSGVALANWQLDLWKGGIWSDGKNITVEGNVTAKGDMSGNTVTASTAFVGNVTGNTTGEVSATSLQLGNVQTIGYGAKVMDSGTSATITVSDTLPGDYALVTIDNSSGTSASLSAGTTTDSVVVALSADPATTYTLFSAVFRIVD